MNDPPDTSGGPEPLPAARGNATAGRNGNGDGDEPWESRLFAHGEEVRRFVRRALSSPEDAEDVFQQTMLQAHRRRETFHGENFRAWLFTIARHLIVDHYRTNRRFTFVDVDEVGLGNAEPALQVTTEMVRGGFEGRERLHHCLHCVTRRVSMRQQIALLLADFYGFTDKESAVALKLTLPSFKKLLHKARARLRAAAMAGCALVASGECPILPGADPKTLEPVPAEVRCVTGPTAAEGPPESDGAEYAALLALRRELLEGLGHKPDGSL